MSALGSSTSSANLALPRPSGLLKSTSPEEVCTDEPIFSLELAVANVVAVTVAHLRGRARAVGGEAGECEFVVARRLGGCRFDVAV